MKTKQYARLPDEVKYKNLVNFDKGFKSDFSVLRGGGGGAVG